MTIQELQDELRSQVRARIGRGELTGSGLAQDAGFPQGHLSNFLNSRRGLSVQSMDRLLEALGIGVLDLMADEVRRRGRRSRNNHERVERVALVSGEHAALARFTPGQVLGTRGFEASFLRRLKARVAVDRRDWLRFVLVKVDANGLPGPLRHAGATLLIDRHYSSLEPYRRRLPNLYAVKHEGRCVAAYVSLCENCLVLRRDDPQREVEMIRIQHRESYFDYVVGRVCHVGIEV